MVGVRLGHRDGTTGGDRCWFAVGKCSGAFKSWAVGCFWRRVYVRARRPEASRELEWECRGRELWIVLNGIWESSTRLTLLRVQPASGQGAPFRGIDRIRAGTTADARAQKAGEKWRGGSRGTCPPAKGSTRAKPDTPGWAAGRTDRIAKFKKKKRK